MPTIIVSTRTDTAPLDSLLDALPARAASAVHAAADDVIADIRANWSALPPSAPGAAPAVVSGALDSSLGATPLGDSGLDRTAYRVSAGTPYAPLLEFGTSRMAARPFLRPALWRALQTITARFKEMFS